MNSPSNATPGPVESRPAATPAPPQAQPQAPPPLAVEQPRRAWYPDHAAAAGPRGKSPALACILSVVPGLGQIYVGYYVLGFIHAIVVGSLLTLMVLQPSEEIMSFLVLFFVFFMLYNIVDAGRRAAFYNQVLAGIPGVELPTDLKLPRPGGSIFGGVALIVVGLILLGNTAFGMTLEWVQSWWPLAPIFFGGWLLYRAIQDKAEKE